MIGIGKVLRTRDVRREAEATARAKAALDALEHAEMPAWLVGSLARGTFRQHSDIDILIDVAPARRTAALRICLAALGGFPSSIVFKADVPDHALPHFLAGAADEPSLRG